MNLYPQRNDEAKYNSMLNKKQQKLFDATKADKKIVIDGYKAFLDLPIELS